MKQRGYTLIELMIIVGILGIMLTVLFSFLSRRNLGDEMGECRARCRPQALKETRVLDGRLECVCDATTLVK